MKQKEKNRTIEEAFAALDEIVEKLERKDITLEESFQIYQQGMELLHYCNEKVDTVEKKLLQMNEDGTLSEL